MNKQKSETWSQYWANEGASGEVFVDASGHKHTELTNYWACKLDKLTRPGKVIDLACGAGSIFANLLDHTDIDLFGVDVSLCGLEHFKQRFPTAHAINCSLDKLSVKPNSFDVVVSQFGIEYQGSNAFLDAFNLLNDNGKLICIVHYEDGYIDLKNKRELTGIQLIKELDFIEKALSLANALYSDDKNAFNSKADAFVEVEPILARYVKNNQFGFHNHLYNGTRELFAHHTQYKLVDIEGWLLQMKSDINESKFRLECMIEVAISKLEMKELTEKLSVLGATNLSVKPFYLPNHNAPLAWALECDRANGIA